MISRHSRQAEKCLKIWSCPLKYTPAHSFSFLEFNPFCNILWRARNNWHLWKEEKGRASIVGLVVADNWSTAVLTRVEIFPQEEIECHLGMLQNTTSVNKPVPTVLSRFATGHLNSLRSSRECKDKAVEMPIFALFNPTTEYFIRFFFIFFKLCDDDIMLQCELEKIATVIKPQNNSNNNITNDNNVACYDLEAKQYHPILYSLLSLVHKEQNNEPFFFCSHYYYPDIGFIWVVSCTVEKKFVVSKCLVENWWAKWTQRNTCTQGVYRREKRYQAGNKHLSNGKVPFSPLWSDQHSTTVKIHIVTKNLF